MKPLKAMGLFAEKLHELGLVDEVIAEPLGGAHRDMQTMSANVKTSIVNNLATLRQLPQQELLEQRYQRLIAMGR